MHLRGLISTAEVRMAIAIRNEGSRINSSINVTPMVDVMLVLLIIFMVVVPMLRPGVPLQMAKTKNPIDMSDASKADALIVSIMHDGQVFFGSQRANSDVLTQKLKERLGSRADKTVFVRADARVRYSAVVNAVDDIRSAGVDQLGC
jgi:biopolymer transport protein ExbD/biopolymer transport protein TolR